MRGIPRPGCAFPKNNPCISGSWVGTSSGQNRSGLYRVPIIQYMRVPRPTGHPRDVTARAPLTKKGRINTGSSSQICDVPALSCLTSGSQGLPRDSRWMEEGACHRCVCVCVSVCNSSKERRKSVEIVSNLTATGQITVDLVSNPRPLRGHMGDVRYGWFVHPCSSARECLAFVTDLCRSGMLPPGAISQAGS